MGGHGTLTVRTALDREKLLVEFGDTGPGVPKDIQPRIFEPFFTPSRWGRAPGSGSTSLADRVKKHHGEINPRVRPGDTRFRVWLPLSTRTRNDRSRMTRYLGSPVRPAELVPAAWSAMRSAAGGFTCAGARSAGTSAAATPPVPARQRALEGGRSPGHPELRAGRGLVLELPGRAAVRAGPGAAPPDHHPRDQSTPVPRTACPPTGSRT